MHTRKPRPVFDFLHTMSLSQLAEYTDTEFRKRMAQVTPNILRQYYIGRFPEKDYTEWSSVDLGRIAYLILYVNAPCKSWFEDQLRSFQHWYTGLSETQKEKAKAFDRACYLREENINANVPNLTWSESWDVVSCFFSSLVTRL